MKLFLKLLFGAIFLWMTVMTIRTSLAVSLLEAWPSYAANPWAVATLYNAYFAQPVRISLAQILDLIRADTWTAIATLWKATMHALVAWLALGSLASLLIYALLTPALRRLGESLRAESQ